MALGLALLLLLATVGAQPVILQKLSQTYLPFKFSTDGTPSFCLGEAAAEQIAYDANAYLLYVSGSSQLRVLNLTDPTQPEVIATQSIPGEVTDVAFCGAYIAATVPSDPESLPGTAFIYAKYSSGDGLTLKHSIPVGSLPDSLVFTPDCSKIIVGNEGEAGMTKDGTFVNPEGSITVIDMKALEQGKKEATQTIDFTSYNSNPSEVTDAGVRWIWRGQGLRPSMKAGQTLSRDLEPEQVVVSDDGRFVFVNLQENNGLAILDLKSMRFTSLTGYGEKDLSLERNALDTSETDGPGRLRTWKGLFALYQPDVISIFHHEGEEFIITANEGDQKEYNEEDQGIPEWIEFVDGEELVNRTKDVDDVTVAALGDPDGLGQLPISTVDGVAGTNDKGETVHDRLVTYGGRSWSIFKADGMERVYDSGNDFERVLAQYIPWAYNSNAATDLCLTPEATAEASLESETLIDPERLDEIIDEAKDAINRRENAPDSDVDVELPPEALTMMPNDTIDTRSTSRGPEPEALVVGYLNDRRIVIVGIERGNALFVYDASDPLAPIWQSTYYPGAHGKTWAELYNNKEVVDIDPEGMVWVNAKDSPIQEPLVIVSGAISGTVSIHAVRTADINPDCDQVAEVVDDGKTTLVISTQTAGC